MDVQSYYPLMQVYGVEIPTRCFVGGLPYSMTELELNKFFSQFGTVKDSKIITDRKGVSKGYGFVTYQTEQEAADVCARGSLYYKEKKLNISKAIRRQGGQYMKANQEYVNGQRMLYQSTEGYLLAQKNGAWVMEEPSPFCQPAKPCFQVLSPVLMGAHNTGPYLQPPVTPAYYSAIPPSSVPPYEPLPHDPGPLYCSMVEATAGTHMPPPPQHIVSHTQVLSDSTSTLLEPDSDQEPQHSSETEGVAPAVTSDGCSTTLSSPSTTPTTSSSLDNLLLTCHISEHS